MSKPTPTIALNVKRDSESSSEMPDFEVQEVPVDQIGEHFAAVRHPDSIRGTGTFRPEGYRVIYIPHGVELFPLYLKSLKKAVQAMHTLDTAYANNVSLGEMDRIYSEITGKAAPRPLNKPDRKIRAAIEEAFKKIKVLNSLKNDIIPVFTGDTPEGGSLSVPLEDLGVKFALVPSVKWNKESERIEIQPDLGWQIVEKTTGKVALKFEGGWGNVVPEMWKMRKALHLVDKAYVENTPVVELSESFKWIPLDVKLYQDKGLQSGKKKGTVVRVFEDTTTTREWFDSLPWPTQAEREANQKMQDEFMADLERKAAPERKMYDQANQLFDQFKETLLADEPQDYRPRANKVLEGLRHLYVEKVMLLLKRKAEKTSAPVPVVPDFLAPEDHKTLGKGGVDADTYALPDKLFVTTEALQTAYNKTKAKFDKLGSLFAKCSVEDLRCFVEARCDKSSPMYHRDWTPVEFANELILLMRGPTRLEGATIPWSKVETWLDDVRGEGARERAAQTQDETDKRGRLAKAVERVEAPVTETVSFDDLFHNTFMVLAPDSRERLFKNVEGSFKRTGKLPEAFMTSVRNALTKAGVSPTEEQVQVDAKRMYARLKDVVETDPSPAQPPRKYRAERVERVEQEHRKSFEDSAPRWSKSKQEVPDRIAGNRTKLRQIVTSTGGSVCSVFEGFGHFVGGRYDTDFWKPIRGLQIKTPDRIETPEMAILRHAERAEEFTKIIQDPVNKDHGLYDMLRSWTKALKSFIHGDDGETVILCVKAATEAAKCLYVLSEEQAQALEEYLLLFIDRWNPDPDEDVGPLLSEALVHEDSKGNILIGTKRLERAISELRSVEVSPVAPAMGPSEADLAARDAALKILNSKLKTKSGVVTVRELVQQRVALGDRIVGEGVNRRLTDSDFTGYLDRRQLDDVGMDYAAYEIKRRDEARGFHIKKHGGWWHVHEPSGKMINGAYSKESEAQEEADRLQGRTSAVVSAVSPAAPKQLPEAQPVTPERRALDVVQRALRLARDPALASVSGGARRW